jgi:hypothetical protein
LLTAAPLRCAAQVKREPLGGLIGHLVCAMYSFKGFVIPDREKMRVFVLFALIMIGGLIQRAPLIESPPSPRLSPLGDFSFTLLSFLLSFPYLALVFLIGLRDGVLLHRFSWLVIAGNVSYLYFISCLFVFGFNHYKHRFSKWHWVVIWGIPFLFIILYLIYLQIPAIYIDDLMNYLGAALIVLLYLYLLFCLGFFVQEITKRRISAA